MIRCFVRLLWLLPLGLCSCVDRVEQCNTVVRRLNPHTEAILQGVESLARVESEPGLLDSLRAAIDRADRDLRTLDPSTPPLVESVLRYRHQLRYVREAADAMEQAARTHDTAGLNAAAKRADAFLELQAATVEELNAYCSGKTQP